jgi:hypothetical protein
MALGPPEALRPLAIQLFFADPLVPIQAGMQRTKARLEPYSPVSKSRQMSTFAPSLQLAARSATEISSFALLGAVRRDEMDFR